MVSVGLMVGPQLWRFTSCQLAPWKGQEMADRYL
jgi:hypothetical protein